MKKIFEIEWDNIFLDSEKIRSAILCEHHPALITKKGIDVKVHEIKPELKEPEQLCPSVWQVPKEWCEHIYESDCHGIEMIKDPKNVEIAIGGTNTIDRWLYDPWCGKRISNSEKVVDVPKIEKLGIASAPAHLEEIYVKINELIQHINSEG